MKFVIMKGENMGNFDVAFKLIGKLGSQKVYRRLADVPISMGIPNSTAYTRSVLFKFVNNAGQVTKEVARDVVDYSSVRKSALKTMQKEGWTKLEKYAVRRKFGAWWSIKDNRKSVQYSYLPSCFRKYMKQGDYKEEVFVGFSNKGKKVSASQFYTHSDLFPHLDINKLRLNLHTYCGDISEYLKGLHSLKN